VQRDVETVVFRLEGRRLAAYFTHAPRGLCTAVARHDLAGECDRDQATGALPCQEAGTAVEGTPRASAVVRLVHVTLARRREPVGIVRMQIKGEERLGDRSLVPSLAAI
jgi:hypothetical protein